MKGIHIILLLVLILGGIWYFKTNSHKIDFPAPTTSQTAANPTQIQNNISYTVVAENLDTPWSLVFLPDNSILFTERSGKVRLVDSHGNLEFNAIATLTSVIEKGEGGLLGITIHPDFVSNHFVYLYYTYNDNNQNTLNRVVRMTYNNKKLSEEKVVVDKIPGASFHNGGRIKFGPDKYLYITTGDAENPSRAQDTHSLSGKILRVTDEGNTPPENPFNNLIYSYGHRNPQGIAWDKENNLWSTEHGPSGAETGNDELNKIEKGKNYGWPTIRGQQSHTGMEKPIIESGKQDTWAPAGLAVINDKLYFAGLKGKALYEYNPATHNLKEYFKEDFGRIRDVIKSPSGDLYITTSNKDGRGDPKDSDDKIIRISSKAREML